jgi:hypothetical protein
MHQSEFRQILLRMFCNGSRIEYATVNIKFIDGPHPGGITGISALAQPCICIAYAGN